MSSNPTNSSGTANTTGPSQSSAPSSPSAQTMEDVISVPSLHPDDSKSRAQLFCSSGSDTNASASNQMVRSFFLLSCLTAKRASSIVHLAPWKSLSYSCILCLVNKSTPSSKSTDFIHRRHSKQEFIW